MGRTRNVVIGFLAISAVSAVGSLFAIGLPSRIVAPKVVIRIAADSVKKYDTIKVTATPYSTTGRKSSSSTITWQATPSGVVRVVTTGSHGQSAIIIGVNHGTAKIIASWKRSDALLVKDSINVFQVALPDFVTDLTLFTRLDTAGNIAREDSIYIGDQRCIYVFGKDKTGAYLTGSPVTLKSSDTTIIKQRDYPGWACPDTTIDPTLLPHPTPVPPVDSTLIPDSLKTLRRTPRGVAPHDTTKVPPRSQKQIKVKKPPTRSAA